MAGKLRQLLKNNSLLPLSQFSYRRRLETCGALRTLSHHIQVGLDRDIEERLIQLSFSVGFDWGSHCGRLYILRSFDIGGQFLCIVSEFFNDRTQRVRLDAKVSASVGVVLEMPNCSVLGPL